MRKKYRLHMLRNLCLGKWSRHRRETHSVLCCSGGVGSLPYLGLSCLLFSCCECGCGRASSLCAVAHPSLIWLVFPAASPLCDVHLSVLSPTFLYFLHLCSSYQVVNQLCFKLEKSRLQWKFRTVDRSHSRKRNSWGFWQ